MKNRVITALAMTGLIWTPCLSADEIRTERVQFEKGTTSAHLEGTIVGYETVDHVLGAAVGQTMVVSIETNNTFLFFNVLRGDSDEALFVGSGEAEPSSWSGELPVDGDYMVRVYLMRNEARRDGKAHYSMDISITDPDQGDS